MTLTKIYLMNFADLRTGNLIFNISDQLQFLSCPNIGMFTLRLRHVENMIECGQNVNETVLLRPRNSLMRVIQVVCSYPGSL